MTQSLSWKSFAEEILYFHECYVAADSNWTQEKTASAHGITPAATAVNIAVARAIRGGNAKILSANGLSDAYNKLKAQKISVMESIEFTLPTAPIQARELHPANNNRPFNFIYCDFPTETKAYNKALYTLAHRLSSVMAHYGHIMIWSEPKFHSETIKLLTAYVPTLKFYPNPLVWAKTNKARLNGIRASEPIHAYATALLASRNTQPLMRIKSDVHISHLIKQEKPAPVLRHFFSMLCNERTEFLDAHYISDWPCKVAKEFGACRTDQWGPLNG